MGGMSFDENAKAKLEELREHVTEAGEDLALAAEDAELEEVWNLETALVRLQGEHALWAVPASQDWEHDMLDGAETIMGTLYADDEPFTSSSSSLTGYFQAEESGKWLRIDGGKAAMGTEHSRIEWKDDLADFPAVEAQMQAAMDVSEYRHLVEKTVIQQLTTSQERS